MNKKKLDQLVSQLEDFVECWKQFNTYIALARTKKFTQDDEIQFLEIKSVIIQELEMILGSIEAGGPNKEEVHALICAAPSIRYMSELQEGSVRAIENNWHKVFLGIQALVGQLKVAQKNAAGESMWGKMFGKKK
mgnify:CR=1 FL=1